MNEPVLIRSFAKLNLALAVAPPEPAGTPRAGWHRICSWFVPIALHDELELTPLARGKASRFAIQSADDAPRQSPIDWPIEKDLAVRAHGALEKFLGCELPVEMTLRKRIPVGGGLGGGSSNAAAMLRGLRSLFDLDITIDQLRTLSAPLGSDVAFFLDEDREPPEDDADAPDDFDVTHAPRSAIVSGFGETIVRVDTPQEDVLLLVPGFGCPTPAVYRAFDALPARDFDEARVHELARRASAASFAAGADGDDDAEGPAIPVLDLFNDLAAAACAVEPRLKRVMELALAPTEIPVYVTGSGSTLFVPFHIEDDEEAINRLADLAEQNLPRDHADGLGVVAVPTRVV